MILKHSLCAILIFSYLIVPAQVYDINLDFDRDGIMNDNDENPKNRDIPFDSIFNYNFCSGEETSIDLGIVYPGLIMKWDTCNAFDGYVGYGKRFIPKSYAECYSTLYDTVTRNTIRKLVHVMNVGNERLKLKIDKIEKKSFRRQLGVNVVLNEKFEGYNWTVNGKWHENSVMNIGRFYKDGLVNVIGVDKFGCQDTLEFDIRMNEHYTDDKKESVIEYSQFNPAFQKFENLKTATGVVDLRFLTGKYEGPYTYNLSEMTDIPEQTFRNSKSYHDLFYDNKSKKGSWNFEQEEFTFEVRPLGKKQEIMIHRNGKLITGQLIKLDASILRILYSDENYQRIEEFYRMN